MKQSYIIWYLERFGFMPDSAATAQQDHILRILPGKLFEKDIILKHQPNRLGIVENFGQFADFGVNFFEASMASESALFGCSLLGGFFVHPCRCST